MSISRDRWIDISKGIGIILVVAGHVENAYTGKMMILHDFIYCFHMPLFLFISGYLAQASIQRHGHAKTVKASLVSYGIPYVFFSALYWLFKMVGKRYVHSALGVKDLLLIGVYPISFMWFMYVLLISSILTSLLCKANKANYAKVSIVIGVVLYLLWTVLNMVHVDKMLSESIAFDFMKNYIWFALGLSYGERIITWKPLHAGNKTVMWLVSVTILGVLLVVCHFGLDKLPFVRAIWAYLGIEMVLLFSLAIVHCRWLEYLGRNTLPVYVLHGTLTSALQVIIKIPNAVLQIGLCTILAITLSLLCQSISTKIAFFDFWFRPGRYIKDN